MLFLMLALAFLWQACFEALASSTTKTPNILLIISDDYRPEGRIGLDPHPGGQLFGTPNLDKLARQSIVYDAAFATSPSCGPSRTSFLTGYTPDKLRYWSFVSNHWRDSGRARFSLPEYFRSRGYRTVALGKIFHWDDLHRDDAEYSWDKVTYTGPFSGGESKCSAAGELFCRCLDNVNCVDENLAREAMGELTWLSNQNKPWFLALGFRRPHMDWALPRGWIDENGMATAPIPMPRYREMDTSVPNEAFYACGPVLEVKGENSLPQGAHVSDALTEKIRRYYWATVNFMDIQLGKVLNHFDSKFPEVAQNTIVVFMSDHGWSLGEKGLWCKQNLFDDSNRVALMIRAPWLQKAGTRVTRPVSILSLFPTLVDLAKIKVPDIAECFGSVSLFSDASEDEVVISQFPRCDAAKGANPYSNPCMNEKPANFKLMGYSMRTKSFRYTEWRRWTGPATQADWSDAGLVSAELYDHRGNNMSPSVAIDFEVVNVYDNPNYASIRASLAFQLRTTVTKPSWASACSITLAPTPKPTSLAPTKNPTTKAPTSSPTVKTKTPTAITTARPTPGPTNPPATTKSPTIATKVPTSKTPTRTPTTKSPTTPQTTISPTIAALPLLKSDLDAFQELYDATNGPQWSSCATSRHDPCNNLVNGCNLRTHFIVCELVNNELRLIELSLPDNNMVGSLPESLFSIPTLTIVDLRSSSISGNPRKNTFSNNECVVAPLCMEADTNCNVANTGIEICATIPANKCSSLTQVQCKANMNVCQFFAGGYGCQAKSFCGFLSKKYLKNSVPAKLAKQGIRKGAPGCMGKENVKRCVWLKNRCVARSTVKKQKKKKKKKKNG